MSRICQACRNDGTDLCDHCDLCLIVDRDNQFRAYATKEEVAELRAELAAGKAAMDACRVVAGANRPRNQD